jgi:hypothetical protein
MKSDLMERDELVAKIHSQRFKIMQHYLFLYGDRLEGRPCRYDRYNDGALIGSREGEACHKALLTIQKEEMKISSMLDRLEVLSEQVQTQ